MRGRAGTPWFACLCPVLTAAACAQGAACRDTADCPEPLECLDSHCGVKEVLIPAPDCRRLLEANPELSGRDDVYQLEQAGAPAPISAWCDMTSAGGGWTLVGRSGDVGRTPAAFGWRGASGDVEDLANPYAIGANKVDLPFTEILYGDVASGRAWHHAYRITVPANFLSAYRDAAYEVGLPTTVHGDCVVGAGTGVGFMGAWVGHTGDTEEFFFRDNAMNENFGLQPWGWNLSGSDTDCDRNGRMQGHVGMVMVR